MQVGVRAAEGSGDRHAVADRGCHVLRRPLDVRGSVKINHRPNKKRGYWQEDAARMEWRRVFETVRWGGGDTAHTSRPVFENNKRRKSSNCHEYLTFFFYFLHIILSN